VKRDADYLLRWRSMRSAFAQRDNEQGFFRGSKLLTDSMPEESILSDDPDETIIAQAKKRGFYAGELP